MLATEKSKDSDTPTNFSNLTSPFETTIQSDPSISKTVEIFDQAELSPLKSKSIPLRTSSLKSHSRIVDTHRKWTVDQIKFLLESGQKVPLELENFALQILLDSQKFEIHSSNDITNIKKEIEFLHYQIATLEKELFHNEMNKHETLKLSKCFKKSQKTLLFIYQDLLHNFEKENQILKEISKDQHRMNDLVRANLEHCCGVLFCMFEKEKFEVFEKNEQLYDFKKELEKLKTLYDDKIASVQTNTYIEELETTCQRLKEKCKTLSDEIERLKCLKEDATLLKIVDEQKQKIDSLKAQLCVTETNLLVLAKQNSIIHSFNPPETLSESETSSTSASIEIESQVLFTEKAPMVPSKPRKKRALPPLPKFKDAEVQVDLIDETDSKEKLDTEDPFHDQLVLTLHERDEEIKSLKEELLNASKKEEQYKETIKRLQKDLDQRASHSLDNNQPKEKEESVVYFEQLKQLIPERIASKVEIPSQEFVEAIFDSFEEYEKSHQRNHIEVLKLKSTLDALKSELLQEKKDSLAKSDKILELEMDIRNLQIDYHNEVERLVHKFEAEAKELDQELQQTKKQLIKK